MAHIVAEHFEREAALKSVCFVSGKPFGKCGNCHRYMKYISVRPARLYCPTCEDVYPVPQGGTVKLYSGLTCPLDGFELALFSLGGKDGKTYPFCPFCFSHPPFENAKKVQCFHVYGESISWLPLPSEVFALASQSQASL